MILYTCQKCSKLHLESNESAAQAICPETSSVTRICNPSVFGQKEWETCAEPEVLLGYIKGMCSARKLRLFACACAAQCSKTAKYPLAQRLIETSERFIEGGLTQNDLKVAYEKAGAVPTNSFPVPTALAYFAALATLEPDAFLAALGSIRLALSYCPSNAYKASQVALVHEVFGNPFNVPIAVNPVSAVVLKLARSLYQFQGNVYREALQQELRRTGRDVLVRHFASRSHPRGCWVLDLLLGMS